MTIYINGDVIRITSKGVTTTFLYYDIKEALKAFKRDGNQITNKRIKSWMNQQKPF